MWTILAQEQTSKDWSNIIDQLARTPLSKVIAFVAICTIVRVALYPLLTKIPVHRRGFGFALGRFLNEALDAVVYAGVFVFLLIRPFCIQAFKIPSGSMKDTLLEGDFIVANKAIYRYTDPKINDIVVFRPPKWACTPDQIDTDGQVNVDFIKRCEGVPGDVIEIKNGTLYRNGRAITEPYIREAPDKDFKLVVYHPADEPTGTAVQKTYWPLSMSRDHTSLNNDNQTATPYAVTSQSEQDVLRNLPPAAIPKGYYLMMGDNRNESFDGRAWGLVPRDEIIGRSEFIWMPISRWRRTR